MYVIMLDNTSQLIPYTQIMQLTQFTDYSIRSLIFLAVQEEGHTSNISDIALAYTIPKNHLTKIINNLSNLGLVQTSRGKNGGLKLVANTLEIDLKTLVMMLEPHFDLVPCFNPEKQNCCIAPTCKLKNILYQAQQAFFDVLAQSTFKDVVQSPSELQSLLGVPIRLKAKE